MRTWKEFYSQIKAESWPECSDEKNFSNLPEYIQKECIEKFNYKPGDFLNKLKLENKVFPIKTSTACKLKWSWSSIFLTTETTASCHRTNHHKFDTNTFDFHNTKEKLHDRQQMLNGQWPVVGCDYCRNIEQSGGISDRLTNLNLVGMYHPHELDLDAKSINVTPRILEVYFDNTCNLKCVYCGPHFSSLWDAENIQFGQQKFEKSKNIESNKQKIFEYLKINNQHLTLFNFLGGEPLFQKEFTECLEIFEHYPAPNLKLQIFTNLNIQKDKLILIVNKIHNLISKGCLLAFEITASLDCWGESQEYVRFPLKLKQWEENFLYLLEQSWINLIIGSTITPLTIKTLPNLLEKINSWSKTRKIYHYQNSVTGPDHQLIDIFGDIFGHDFDRALELKPETTLEEISSKEYLKGIAKQSASKNPDVDKIKKLFEFLTEMDYRRKTNWQKAFPWLIDEFAKYKLYA